MRQTSPSLYMAAQIWQDQRLVRQAQRETRGRAQRLREEGQVWGVDYELTRCSNDLSKLRDMARSLAAVEDMVGGIDWNRSVCRQWLDAVPLSPQQRQIAELRAQGRTWRAIATLLGQSLGNVQRQGRRAASWLVDTVSIQQALEQGGAGAPDALARRLGLSAVRVRRILASLDRTNRGPGLKQGQEPVGTSAVVLCDAAGGQARAVQNALLRGVRHGGGGPPVSEPRWYILAVVQGQEGPVCTALRGSSGVRRALSVVARDRPVRAALHGYVVLRASLTPEFFRILADWPAIRGFVTDRGDVGASPAAVPEAEVLQLYKRLGWDAIPGGED